MKRLFSIVAGGILLLSTGSLKGQHGAETYVRVQDPQVFTLTLQRRNAEGLIRVETTKLKGSQTAIVVMDMWDKTWCKSVTRKCEEMVEPMNKTLNAARQLGITIVFSPSDVTDFYKDLPQRKVMKTLPYHSMPEKQFDPPQAPWNKTGGCECGPDRPCNKNKRNNWTRQHKDLTIKAGDFITEDPQELYNLCRAKGITNLLYMGKASNMCVLNRPTGLIPMTRKGLNCIVVRDLTEATTGNGIDPDTDIVDPDFTPEAGSRAVISHIEQHIAPTISANQLFIAADIDDDIYKRVHTEPVFTKEEVKNHIPKGATKCFRHFCFEYNLQGRTLSDIPKKFTKADPVEYAKFCKKMNLDAALVLAVPSPGYCTYDTKAGVQFPGLKGDWFGQVVRELHKRNISALAYITLGTNFKYMIDHVGKTYIHTTFDENGVIPDPDFDELCFNAPGYLGLVEAYTREVLENYPVDGLRYDMFFGPQACDCKGCKAMYKELYGEDLTSWNEITKNHRKRRYLFYLETLNRTSHRLHNLCRQIKPSVETWQNHINTYSYANVNLGRDYDIAYIEFGDPLRLLALRGILNKDAIIVGQTLKSPIRRLIMALGARCYQYVGVDQETILPYEKDLDWFNNDLSPFFKMVSEVQPYLEEAKLPTDIGIVFSETTRYHFPKFTRKPYMQACRGIAMSYLDSSIPVQFINCLDLKIKDLKKYKLLMLPRTSGLTSEELGYLKGYVNNGGNLLVTGDALLFDETGDKRSDFSLSDELGLQFENVIADSLEADIKIHSSKLEKFFRLSGKVQLAGLVQTMPASGETLVSTSYKGKEFPLLHINKYGKGNVAYVASSASTDLIRQTGDLLSGPMFLVVSDPQKQVVLSHQEKRNRYVLHLLGDGDYSVFIDKYFVGIDKAIKQYPETGWDYNVEKAENGVQIKVSGNAKDRLLVLQ